MRGSRFGPILLVDFDGTITAQDSELFVAATVLDFSGQRILMELVRAYEHLEIGLSRYYEEYFRLLDLPEVEYRTLAGRVPLRPGFGRLVAACRRKNVELLILSEGLDLFIDPLLDRLKVGNLAISCNRVVWMGNGPMVLPAVDAKPCGRCVNCKGEHARRFAALGRSVGVLGNGASDLCAAREADTVFARDHLQRLCRQEGIAHRPWLAFSDIDLEHLTKGPSPE